LLLESTSTSTPDAGKQSSDQAFRCVGLRPPPKFQERPRHRSFGGCRVAAGDERQLPHKLDVAVVDHFKRVKLTHCDKSKKVSISEMLHRPPDLDEPRPA